MLNNKERKKAAEVYPDGAFSRDLHRWEGLVQNTCGLRYSQNYVLDLWEGTTGLQSFKTMKDLTVTLFKPQALVDPYNLCSSRM